MRTYRNDLTRSDAAFVAVVWPAISEALGGGRIEKVPDSHPLDRFGGVDFWQVRDDITALRGIAVRVQQCRKSFDTFTIRKARPSGTGTEWEKRLRAADAERVDGWLLPALTLQAYVTDYTAGPLLSVAWIRTTNLTWAVRSGIGRDEVNGDDGVVFTYVAWDELPAHEITIVRPARSQRVA